MRRFIRIVLMVLVLILLVPVFIWVRYIVVPTLNAKPLNPTIPQNAVIAHRAASYLAPEATEPAYLLARDMGADYLEIDAHRTKDHVLIAIHDDTPARTTDAAKVFPGREKQPLNEFTLDELKQLDAGSWFNAAYPDRARPTYANVRILTIDEVITIAESGTNKPSLHIETKSPESNPGFEKELVELLGKRGWLGKYDNGISKVTFQSFYASSLARLKELAPDVPRIYLLAGESVKKMGWDKIWTDARELADGIGPVGTIAWPWNIAKAHEYGLAVHAYTVNETWQYRLLLFFGADGLFTDRCDLLLRHYGRPVASPDEILKKYDY